MKIGRRQTIILVLIIAIACAVWLWPVMTHINSVPFWPGAEYTDLLVSHYPNAVMVHTSFSAYRQVPMWNPTILGGTPANADPLVGLWYLPRWITFILPSIWVFNLLVWAHLVLAGVGAFRLVRLEGASRISALAAGIFLAGMPRLTAHLALGHIDLIFALSWTPWAVLALRSTLLHIANKEPALLSSIGLGMVGGFVFLADPRWLLPVVLLLILYAAAFLGRQSTGGSFAVQQFSRLGGSVGVSSLAAALVAAPLALPLLQYTALSTRRLLTAGDQELYALPLVRIIGLGLPLENVPEFVGYLGLALLLLLLAGVILRSRPARRWGLLSLFFMVLALGSTTPLYSLLAALPGFNLLRVPARYLALVGLAISLGGAHALDALLDRNMDESLLKRLKLASVGVAAGALGLAILFFRGQDDGWLSMIQVGLSGVGALLLILGWKRLGQFRRFYPALWIAFIMLDFLSINIKMIEVRPVDWEPMPIWMEAINSAEWGQHRVFSPSYSLSQDRAARHQIEMADGVHPLQLSAYYAYMSQAAGFNPSQYSVTVPPFPEGDPAIPWDPDLDSQRLGKMNVAYVLSDYPLSAPGLKQLVEQNIFIYENSFYRPRAWVEPGDESQPWRPVEQISWSPNRIVIQATGPGQLVLSEVEYPGWTVTSDGEAADSVLYDGLLRSVLLPEGQHQVEWVYRPTLTWIGLCGWGLLILSLAAIRLKWWS